MFTRLNEREFEPSPTRLYFAYGSNLNMEQMQRRCPDSFPVGRARLVGWRLQYRSVLTIVRANGCDVLGGLWQTSTDDERSLDVYEGWPSLYRKELVTVQMGDSDEFVQAYVYIMNDGRHELAPPSPYYLDVCLQGANDFGIDQDRFIKPIKSAQPVVKTRRRH